MLETCADISVIIPTKNRPGEVAEAARSVLDQHPAPMDLIIVDQSAAPDAQRSVFRTYSESIAYQRTKLYYVLDPIIPGLTHARNAGLLMSRRRFVVYVDDDAVLAPGALAHLVMALDSHPRLVAVGGIITNYARPRVRHQVWLSLFSRGPFRDERQAIYWDWRRYPPGSIAPTRKLNGGLMAFRREVLTACGGFDERYRGNSVGEDVEISTRLLRQVGRDDALALVGGAWLTHDARGSWRARETREETQLTSSAYLFQKFHSERFRDVVAYGWYVLGLFLMSSGASVARLNSAPLSSFVRGVRSVRSGFECCDFLVPAGADRFETSRAHPAVGRDG